MADLDGNGDVDIASSQQASDVIHVLYGDGTAYFPSWADFASGSSPRSLVAGDFDGNGFCDLFVRNELGAADGITVLPNDLAGGFPTALHVPLGTDASGITAKDLDSDGYFDLLVTLTTEGAVRELLSDFGAGGVLRSGARDYPAGTGPEWVSGADFDGDGDCDLVVSNTSVDEINTLMRDVNWTTFDFHADGTFNISDPVALFDYLFVGGPGPGCPEAMDFNLDGGLDISDGVAALQFLFAGGAPPAWGLGCQCYPTCPPGPC